MVVASPTGVLSYKEGGLRVASSFRVIRSFPGAFTQGTGEPKLTTYTSGPLCAGERP